MDMAMVETTILQGNSIYTENLYLGWDNSATHYSTRTQPMDFL